MPGLSGDEEGSTPGPFLSMSSDSESSPPATSSEQHVLVRISATFEGVVDEMKMRLGAVEAKKFPGGFRLWRVASLKAMKDSTVSSFIRWMLPMHHIWPCNPAKMDTFIEKAAQTMLTKFGNRSPQALFVGALNPSSPDPYYKLMASNLRGRLKQVFPEMPVNDVEMQDSNRKTLFCMVGREGLYCGLETPKWCNGLYPGGTKFMPHDTEDMVSRAGAKIVEALHHLRLFRSPPKEQSRWLELGAAPGGMTQELLARHYRVTAVDTGAMDPRVVGKPGLIVVKKNVSEFTPMPDWNYEAVLCDLNGSPFDSIAHVARVSKALLRKGLVVFTLKLPKVESLDEPISIIGSVEADAAEAGLRLIARTHLPSNRNEMTLFFEKTGGR